MQYNFSEEDRIKAWADIINNKLRDESEIKASIDLLKALGKFTPDNAQTLLNMLESTE